MRILLIMMMFFGLSLPMLEAGQNETNTSNKPFALVELFASEGCSSCPPADDLLMRLDQDARQHTKNVFLLSFEVDYWDYLGWKDPYSLPAFTQRQHQYAQALNSNSVYTPQMIINGVDGFVGSDASKARKYIEQYLNTPSLNSITLEIQSIAPQKIEIKYQCEQWLPDIVLNIALVERKAQSQVTAGENSGRLLKHVNVVRDFKTIAFKEKEGQVVIESSFVVDPERYLIIAYLQEVKTMKIITANSVPIKQ